MHQQLWNVGVMDSVVGEDVEHLLGMKDPRTHGGSEAVVDTTTTTITGRQEDEKKKKKRVLAHEKLALPGNVGERGQHSVRQQVKVKVWEASLTAWLAEHT